jgi:MFS family permease
MKADAPPPAAPRTDPESSRPGDPRLWRRALLLLWVGQVVSHLGDSLFLVGIFFLAMEVTGSKAQSGLLIALNFTPALALGLFAGAFVDRHDRRRLMIGADLLRAGAVGAIPILSATGHLDTPLLAICIFLLACGSTLFNPAIKALIPEMISSGQLTGTAALFQISEYAALVAGPLLAELVIRQLGTRHLFTVDAVTFVFSAVCLLMLPAAARRLVRSPRPPPGPVLREVGTGVKAVFASPVLRALLVLLALANLLVMGLAHVATPLLVKETLGLGADAYARAQRFFFLGMVAASAGFWWLGRRAPKGRTMLVGIVLDGLTFIPLAFCHTLGQVQAALFLHALSIPLIIIPRTVLIQQSVPGPLHGRAFALLNVTVFGMMAISSAVTGRLTETVAPQTLFLVLGAAGALPGLIGFLVPALRRAT